MSNSDVFVTIEPSNGSPRAIQLAHVSEIAKTTDGIEIRMISGTAWKLPANSRCVVNFLVLATPHGSIPDFYKHEILYTIARGQVKGEYKRSPDIFKEGGASLIAASKIFAERLWKDHHAVILAFFGIDTDVDADKKDLIEACRARWIAVVEAEFRFALLGED